MKWFVKILSTGLIGLTILIFIVFIFKFFLLPAEMVKTILPQFLKFSGIEVVITIIVIFIFGLIISYLAHHIRTPVVGQFLYSLQNISKSTPVVVPSLYGSGYMIGFLTTKKIAHSQTGEKFIGVFLPCTPNLSTGWLIFFPENQVIKLQQKMAPLCIKWLISGGFLTQNNRSLK